MESRCINYQKEVICATTSCQTNDVNYLCIMDLEYKIKNDREYDIGGTYSEGPDFWFMCSVRKFFSNKVLINLFVCNRKAGSFSLTVGDTWIPVKIHYGGTAQIVLMRTCDDVSRYHFYSLPANTHSFVTTMFLCEREIRCLSKIEFGLTFIEIKIEANTYMSQDIKDNIKLSHDFGKLRNDKESSDLLLISANNNELMAHKAVVGNHSSVLKKQLDASTASLEVPETTSDLDLLLQFMYTGTINEAEIKNYLRLLNLGIKYDVQGLIQLSVNNLKNDITVDNAVNVFQIADTHGLDGVIKEVSSFIKDNPAVFASQSWIELKDVELTKRLLQSISSLE